VPGEAIKVASGQRAAFCNSGAADNLLNMLLQWWLSLLPDSSYGDMRVNVVPGDINGATSLTGRVIRFDSPQAWMIQMAQSGT